MADDSAAPAPAPSAGPYDPAQLQALIAQLTGQGSAAAPPPAPVDRSTVSLLGEALGGGTTGLAPADREAAGTRALLNFGLNMLSASGPSTMPRSFGQVFAQGAGGAEQSLAGSEAVGASRLAAQQAYQEKQQEMRMEAIKAAIPLLKMQMGASTPNTLISGAPGAAPGTGIGAVGSPDEFAQKFTPIAQTIADQTGLPVDYVTAQAAHETGFGKSPAAANNNFFGITDPKTGKLASYATPQDGAAAYVQLMQSDRYKDVPRTGSPAEIGDRMALAGYNSNVPAKDKTDSYGARIGGVASMLAGAKPGAPTAAPPVASGAPGAPAAAPAATAPTAAPTGAPAAPPVITDQPAEGQVAGPGAPTKAAIGAVSPAVPSDVNAIIRGMTGAGADATTLQPPVPAAPPPVQVAGPGAPPAPASTTPPPSVAPAPATAPPGKLTFEQFQAQHPIAPTAEDRASWTVTPPDLTQARAAQAEAARQLSLARAGISGDPNKSLSDYNTATQNVAKLQQDADTKSKELQQTWLTNRLATQRQLYNDEMTRQQTADEADKQRAAAVALKTQEGQQAIDLARVQAGQTYHQKLEEQAATAAQENTIKPMAAAAMKAHQMNLGLSQMLPLLQDLPQGPGLVGSLLSDHPDIAPLLSVAGVINDKQADAVRLINGLVSNISTEMKPTGLGALREYEWDAFKAQLPSMLTSPAGQQKAVALLMNMNNRIQQEGSWMNSYFSRKIPDETTPGRTVPAHNLESDNPNETVQQRMDRELGPIVPSYSGPPSGNGQAQWEQSLPPGKPYYKTWARPDPQNPGRPLRDQSGNVMTTKTLEVRPWQ